MKSRIFVLFTPIVSAVALISFLLFQQHHIPLSQEQKASAVTVSQSVSCSKTPTVAETEGPFYKTGSPERQILYNKSIQGKKFTLIGYVVDINCRPIAHAWLDFWQADGNGHYDNSGFTLRGHQFTDAHGKFTLVTVVPGEYPGRTPHIHVKVRVSDTRPVLTTQLYIPGLASNANDAIYNPTLQMHDVKTTKDGTTATFTFIVKR